MADSRVNMVSFLDFGKWMGGEEEKILELGDGFTELTEDWAPNVSGVTYVNMEAASNTLNNYDFSMTPEREHLSDEAQKIIDEAFRKFPTGKNAETYYYRFFKTDTADAGGYKAIRVPVIVGPSSAGGEGGATLTSSIQINGNGDVEEGTMKFAEGKWTFTVAEAVVLRQKSSPVISKSDLS